MNTKLKSSKGFTMIELLIIIAIISILASIAFVSFDPLKRFRDSRDASRWSDVSATLNAVKIDQIDNGGSYLASISSMVAGEWYMIIDGTMATGCDDSNAFCDMAVGADTYCVDLS